MAIDVAPAAVQTAWSDVPTLWVGSDGNRKRSRPAQPPDRCIQDIFPEGAGRPDGPWSAVEDKDGFIWSPYYGRGNEVTRLNPNTGELIRFPLPFKKTAGIHSAIPSPDGTIWFTEAALSKIGHLNPSTEEITEYENLYPDGKPAGTHTIRVDESGKIWTSGGSTISSFDPATKQFTHYGT